MAKRPNENSSLTQRLERVTSISNQKVQDNKLTKIDNSTFRIREKTDNLQQSLLNLENSLDIKIDNTSSDLQDKLDEILSKLDEMDEKLTSILTILNNIDTLKDDIIAEIKKIIDYLKINIEKPLLDLQKQINDALETLNTLGGKIDRLLTGQDEILLAIGPFLPPNNIFVSIERLLTGQNEIIAGIGAIISILTGEAIDPKNIKPALDNFKNKIKEAIKEWFKDTDEEIYKNSSDYICDKIVGESYIKYDASNLYMPTLIFKFITQNNNNKKKYSQLKLRLNYKTNEITNEFIEKLKFQINLISTVTYIYGGLKSVYVGENRLFKKTIFASNKNESINLLKKLIPLTNTKFLENNISFIENSKRVDNARRKTSLKNIKVNKQINK